LSWFLSSCYVVVLVGRCPVFAYNLLNFWRKKLLLRVDLHQVELQRFVAVILVFCLIHSAIFFFTVCIVWYSICWHCSCWNSHDRMVLFLRLKYFTYALYLFGKINIHCCHTPCSSLSFFSFLDVCHTSL